MRRLWIVSSVFVTAFAGIFLLLSFISTVSAYSLAGEPNSAAPPANEHTTAGRTVSKQAEQNPASVDSTLQVDVNIADEWIAAVVVREQTVVDRKGVILAAQKHALAVRSLRMNAVEQRLGGKAPLNGHVAVRSPGRHIHVRAPTEGTVVNDHVTCVLPGNGDGFPAFRIPADRMVAGA